MPDPVPGRTDKSVGDAGAHADREKGSAATRPFGAVGVVLFVVVLLLAIVGLVYYVFR
ncbi:MAG TPA: hypothetical protein VIG64_01400 [Actinomycetota bacterium]|jgi:hypothetical protein